MKEVDFRTIDKLFIKMSINDKFFVIFALFIIALTTVSIGRYQYSIDQVEQQSIVAAENKLAGMVQALENAGQTDKFAQLGINSSNANISSRQRDTITAVVKTSSQDYVSISQAAPNNENEAKQAAFYSMLLSFLWILPFSLVLYWTATFLGGALWVLWDTTEKIAKGDLSSRLGFHPGRDEFGTIGCALDKAMDTLSELVDTVKTSAKTLQSTSSSFANETRQSEEQIDQQYVSLDSVATAMEEMTASSLEVSGISQKASHQVEQDSEYIKQSYSRVQKAISEIQQLSTYIEQTSNSVTALKVNATKINDVLTTINSISEQTNLLALNAAIEAARAGEMGRGFAVVADEVRTLASRTQSATVEIQAMIANLQSETNNISNITQNTVKQAQSSRELIVNIGTDVNSITQSSQSIIDMSFHIASSAEEQSTVANDISSELSEIRSKSNTIRDLARQSSQGVIQLTAASENIGKILSRYQTAKKDFKRSID